MPHALVELGGLRGILSRLQERPVRRGAGRETGGGGGGGPQHTSFFINTKPCGNKNTAAAAFTLATNGARLR